MLCLVMLQFLAPFIHAHAYGLDDSKEHGFHIHSSEINASSNNQDIANTQISDQPTAGTIITVQKRMILPIALQCWLFYSQLF